MYKIAITIVPLLLILFYSGCSEKVEPNRVDLDQFEIDNSNNYEYIFRDTIREEKRREEKYKKDIF